MTELAAHLGPFLREHLPRDRGASPNTVETYAYSFQLLACFTAERPRYVACNISGPMSGGISSRRRRRVATLMTGRTSGWPGSGACTG